MALHLIKLCVGVDSVEDLRAWIDHRLHARRTAGEAGEYVHVTRMTPQRRDELLRGGSLYWVIRGHVQVHQRLADIRPFRDQEGIARCRLVLEPTLVETEWQPRRPFQGWRYFEGKDVPPDLAAAVAAEMPPALRAELAGLGLL